MHFYDMGPLTIYMISKFKESKSKEASTDKAFRYSELYNYLARSVFCVPSSTFIMWVENCNPYYKNVSLSKTYSKKENQNNLYKIIDLSNF